MTVRLKYFWELKHNCQANEGKQWINLALVLCAEVCFSFPVWFCKNIFSPKPMLEYTPNILNWFITNRMLLKLHVTIVRQINALIGHMSHVMRKPVYAICEQQRRRSACASAQSDQHLCCSLPRQYNVSSFYIRNFKPLASFFGCTGRFESYLVKNPEDRFSRDEAHIVVAYSEHISVYITVYLLQQPVYPKW